MTAAVAGVLLIGAYQAGKHLGSSGSATSAAQAAPEAVLPSSGLAQQARPNGLPSGLATRLPGDLPQVPPAFAQQLRQVPTVVPPPGQAASSGDTDAFGLHP